ncbi:MAG TPA: fatty acid desaturase [Vineibacter sp.]|nr:fatty acid desaturase [Vineibacter sp.]
MENERTPTIMVDERVRSVRWRDLRTLGRAETIGELLMPLPWLALSLGLAHAGHYAWALPASFMFFLTGLRQIHDSYHGTLGLSRRGDDWVMLVQSVLMMSAMHAVKINHLRHHRLCMAEGDVEARSARMSALGAIAFGPLFPLLLLREAFRSGPARDRRWLKVELGAIAAWVALAFVVLEWDALRYHVIAMTVGECFTAFFCVWTVHHGCDREHFIARTSRQRFWNGFFYDMFFHIEHHLFPGVPTRHLHRLAARLDAAAPELRSKDVWVIEDIVRAAAPVSTRVVGHRR